MHGVMHGVMQAGTNNTSDETREEDSHSIKTKRKHILLLFLRFKISMTVTDNNNKIAQNDSIPVAEATIVAAVPQAPTATASTAVASSAAFIYVNLPVGSATGGLTFTGTPVQVAKVEQSELDNPSVQPGLFLHSIQISHDLAISHLHDPNRAQQLLEANAKADRRLCFSAQSPGMGNPDDGLYYAHTLPAHTKCTLEGLQIALDGFPPRVRSVAPTSPMAGKLHANQVVVELRIPGRPTLNAQTPGFTAYRVQQELEHYGSGGGNIVLTVKEALVLRKNEKGTNVACDDCVIL